MEAKWAPINLPNPSVYGWKNIIYEYHQYNYTDQRDAQAQFEEIKEKWSNQTLITENQGVKKRLEIYFTGYYEIEEE